jgi:hypothetical protein
MKDSLNFRSNKVPYAYNDYDLKYISKISNAYKADTSYLNLYFIYLLFNIFFVDLPTSFMSKFKF